MQLHRHGRCAEAIGGAGVGSLHANAVILNDDGIDYRRDVFRQVRDGDPRDFGRRCGGGAHAASQNRFPLNETRGWAFHGLAGCVAIGTEPRAPIVVGCGGVAGARVEFDARASAGGLRGGAFAPP